MTLAVWLGIAFCISQSATLSGLNLAYFTLSKLQLELEAAKGNADARRVLALRRDSNRLLVTILWANVAVNVLLALLSGSALTGVAAFLFSTVLITIVGEIVPQAYFSRNALKMGALLAPVIRIYMLLLYPVAKPTALLLDRWLGPEAIRYFKEQDLRDLISMHARAPESEIDQVEGRGALNFLALDDLPLAAEGEPLDPDSVVRLPFADGRPQFPPITPSSSDPFLRTIHSSGKKWIILVDETDQPRMTLNSDAFLRDALFNRVGFNPHRHCHRPIIVHRGEARLGDVMPRLKVHPERSGDDVIDEDIILLWGPEKRVITGSDILGRLLRGIARTEPTLRS